MKAVVLMLASTLLLVSCVEEPRSCTLIGCVGDVNLSYQTTSGEVPTAVSGTVTMGDRTRDFSCSEAELNDPGNLCSSKIAVFDVLQTWDGQGDAVVRVEMTATVADGQETFSGDVPLMVEGREINGPGCGMCYSGEGMVSLVAN